MLLISFVSVSTVKADTEMHKVKSPEVLPLLYYTQRRCTDRQALVNTVDTGRFVCLFNMGFTSLSTIFQTYRDGVRMWHGSQYSRLECCSLKYHTADT